MNYISIASLLGLNLFIFGFILSVAFKRYSSFSLFIKFLNSFNSSKFLNIIPLFLVGFPNSSEGFNSTTILDGVSLILDFGIFKMNIPLISTFLDFLGIKLYFSIIYWYIDGFLSCLFGVTDGYLIISRIFFHNNSIDYHLKMARLYFKATLENLNKQGEPPLKVLKFLNKGINYYNKFLIHLLKIRISNDVNLLVSLAFMNKAEKISYIEKALNLLKDNVICIKDFLILTSNVVNKPFVQLIMKSSRFENAKHYLELISYIVSWFLAIISIINLVKSFL